MHPLLARSRPWLETARREWMPLLVTALAAGAGALFLLVADQVMEGGTHALDQQLLLSLRAPRDPADPVGPPYIEEAVRDITALGGYAVMTLLSASVLVLLLMWGRRGDALLLLVSVIGSFGINNALKAWFDRPRPDLVAHAVRATSPSFPSGHSMVSAAVYLTLATLLARALPSPRTKAYVIGLALLVTGGVGFSRVYLGVHWPSDVIAGWSAGASWALGTWALATWWERWRAARRVSGSPP